MKDQRKTEIKVGMLVIVGLLIFLWILGWAKNFSLVSNERETTIVFKNVAGLEAGDNVTVNGMREGYVKDMSVIGDDVFVNLALNKEVRLKQDAAFTVAMLDLMGGKRIEIQPGTSGEDFEFSKLHYGRFSADIPFVMSMVGNMQEDLYKTLKEIKITLASLNNYLTDDKLHSDVKNSVANLSNVTDKLDKILQENRTDIKTLLENSAQLSVETKKLVKDNKENISASLSNLKSVLQKTDTLLTKINAVTEETIGKRNNLGKILYDKEFYENLNNSLKQLNELTRILIGELKDEGIKVDAHINIF